MRAHLTSSKIRLSFAALSALIVGAAIALPARSAPGDVDPAFGLGGFVLDKQGTAYRVGRGVAVQPDGKYFVGALAWGWESFAGPLQRFNANHSIDAGYGFQGQALVSGGVGAVMMNGGQAMSAENAYAWVQDPVTFNFHRDIFLVKYTGEGRPDPAFGVGGRTPAFNASIAGEQRFNAMAIAPDGKFVAAGFTTGASSEQRILVARYLANGQLDTGFGTGGWFSAALEGTLVEQEVNGIAVQADGKILISGHFGAPRSGFIARLNADGLALDTTFNGTGVFTILTGMGPMECGGMLHVSPIRTIVACSLAMGSGNKNAILIGFSETGGPAVGFTSQFVEMGNNDDSFRAVTAAPDGSLYAAGYGGAGRIAVAAFDANGVLNTAFGTSGFYTMPEATYSSAWGLAVNGDEVIVTGDTEGPDSAVAVVSLNRTTGVRTSANYYKSSSSHAFAGIKALPGGKIMVAGTVGLNDMPHFDTVRLNADGSFDATYGTGGRSLMPMPNMSFLTGVRDIAIQPDGKVVLAGDYGAQFNAQIRIGAVRMTGAGADASFNAAGTPGYNYVNTGASFAANFTRSVRLQSDGKILAAGSGISGGQRNIAVVRLNTDGTVDTGYGTGGAAITTYPSFTTGRSMDVQADDKAVATGGSGNAIRVVRFTTSGAPDATFGTGGTTDFPMPPGYGLSIPNRIFARPTGKILVVASVFSPTGAGTMAMQFNADGSLDTSFGTGGYGYIEGITGSGANTNAFGAAITPNGRIVAVGNGGDDTAFVAFMQRFTANGQPDASFGTNGNRIVNDPVVRPEFGFVDVMDDGSMLIAGNYSPGAERFGLVVKTVADPTAVAIPAAPRRLADFNNDGRSDVTYIDPQGQAAMWLMDGVTVTGSALLLGPSTGWTVAFNTGDFNADGFADLLWRNVDGRWAIWLMNGTTPIGSALIFGGGNGWEVTHIGDFDGDNRTDLVWRDSTGQVAMWTMNGLAPATSALLFGGGTSWNVTHVGDFDGNARADILWKDGGGQVSMWLMNGTAVTSSGIIFGGGAFSVAKVGDFNGDGRTDLAFTDAGNALAIWLMDGLTPIGSGLVYGGGGFELTHVGDFDGNSRSDLAFKDAGGQVSIWLIDGLTVTGSAIIFGGGGGWNVTHIGDFDGDGRSDLMWKDAGGQVAIWTMNGTAPVNTAVIFGGNGGWVVAP